MSEIEWERLFRALGLSERQRQIVRLLLEDLTEARIAEQLAIAPRTVHSHIERLYRKLGVHSRAQLILRLLLTSPRDAARGAGSPADGRSADLTGPPS